MKESLTPGTTHQFAYKIPLTKTVPHIYTEAPELQVMPEVFATAYMVGLMEWTCVQLLAPHLEPGEGSLGIHVNVSHSAPTPPGFTVTVDVTCVEVNGRRVKFQVSAHDGADLIGKGEHDRFVVHWDQFNNKVQQKAETALG